MGYNDPNQDVELRVSVLIAKARVAPTKILVGNPKNELDLYKIHKLPFSVSNAGTINQLNLPPYFTMNEKLTMHTPLSDKEVDKCIHLGKKWWCAINVLQKQFQEDCSASLLAGRKLDRLICGVQIVGKYPEAIQLNHETMLEEEGEKDGRVGPNTDTHTI